MIVLAGSLMVRLVQLLHTYQNNDTSNLALCVLLQACTLAKSRDLLFARNISQYLNEMNKGIIDRPQLFDSIHYQRSVLVSVCMCRQGDWRLYDPQILPNHMMDRTSRREGTTPNPNPNPSGSASPSNTSDGKVTALTNAVKKAIYLDVLTTMKCPAADKVNLSVADLVVMPTHPETPLRMSEMAAAFEPKTLVSFFCHPEVELSCYSNTFIHTYIHKVILLYKHTYINLYICTYNSSCLMSNVLFILGSGLLRITLSG